MQRRETWVIGNTSTESLYYSVNKLGLDLSCFIWLVVPKLWSLWELDKKIENVLDMNKNVLNIIRGVKWQNWTFIDLNLSDIE